MKPETPTASSNGAAALATPGAPPQEAKDSLAARKPELHREACSSFPDLPDRPLYIHEPTGTGVRLNLRELWVYRELLFFLMVRDIKLRYKQTILGAAWTVLQPLATMVLFTLIFSKLMGVHSDGVPYPLFAFAGLVPWLFFSKALASSVNSLVGSTNLITKVYFPRMIIPLAAVAAGLVDLAVAFVFLLGLVLCYGLPLTSHLLLVPFLVLWITLLALAAGVGLSALNARYRDIGALLPFVLQVGMFATPIIYPADLVP
ncbi:MAG: ABC transporter permease, partial [Planctomycetes bacterium]|nr:ABC transporter permease [Planctomycetota bacterium]